MLRQNTTIVKNIAASRFPQFKNFNFKFSNSSIQTLHNAIFHVVSCWTSTASILATTLLFIE
ncbi:hypothetical protein AO729_19645 [Pseudomonas sp. TTU2014-066ASC]|nr:hypothetical protein AO729_19645 [Pseudomonas sp. TTU2014-066ASC]